MRSGILLGVKICAVFSVFILYLQLNQENVTSSFVQENIKSNAPHIQWKEVSRIKFIRTEQPQGNGIQTLNNTSEKGEHVPNDERKFLFVLHHYEQLAKTTENLLQLAAVAGRIGRVIVEPFVRDSRMCGLPYGWYGQPRRDSRRFHELSLYFDVKFMNRLLYNTSHFSRMVKLDVFKEECRSSAANTTLLHFMYADQRVEEMQKLYNITKTVYQAIQAKTNVFGWCNCDFIDRGLNVSGRIGDLRVWRQICIDADKVKSLRHFQTEILQDDKCVVIIHWRGLGKDRIQFETEVGINSRKLVHSLRPSQSILEQAGKIEHMIGEDYLSVHIRSERQIQWYSIERLFQCLKVLVSTVEKLKQNHKTKNVFLSSDFTRFGSDTLQAFTVQHKSIINKLRRLQKFLFKTLKPVQFNPKSRNPFFMDGGVVALTEMNVLFGGTHLITVGSGTFQQWIVDVFIERKSAAKEPKYWTVTRICHKEDKGKIKTLSTPRPYTVKPKVIQ